MHDSPPQKKWGHHTDRGDQGGRWPDPRECPPIGLEPDVEQKDQYPHLGQHVQGWVAAHEGDPTFAEERGEEVARADPHKELAEDRGLSHRRSGARRTSPRL